MKQQSTYYPHVDGLRTIAVWLVVIFHMYPNAIPGGYLGVDIFFVISGFVITQSLYKQYIKTGTIKIVDFYVRRIKRLYPALLVMLLFTTIGYVIFGLLWDTNLYLKTLITSIFAVSNLYLLYHGDQYFEQDLVNPLVHTWSLGIEEQFYLIFPALLLMVLTIYKLRSKSDKYLLNFFALFTIFLFLVFILNYDNWLGAFYSPFARFWELGVGVTLFFLTQRFMRINSSLALSWLGILSITASMIIAQFFSIFVAETLLAVAGSALIIFGCIGSQNLVQKILTSTQFVLMGKLSYSLYLWHLPVIYFVYLYVPLELFIIIAPAVSVLAALISYNYVENPLRYSFSFDTAVHKLFKLTSAIVGLVLAGVLVTGVNDFRMFLNQSFNLTSEAIKQFNYIETNFDLSDRIAPNYTYRDLGGSDCIYSKAPLSTHPIFGVKVECLFEEGTKDRLFYLTGDSHSLHLLPAFGESAVAENVYFEEMPRQAIVAEKSWNYQSELLSNTIERQIQEVTAFSEKYEEVVLVLSFFLTPWGQIDTIETNLRRYIDEFPEGTKIVFVAPTPIFPSGPESCVILGRHCAVDKVSELNRMSDVRSLFNEFEIENNNVLVYDPMPYICPGSKCFIYQSDTDYLLYIDKDHITPELSRSMSVHLDAWLVNNFRYVE